MYRRPKFVEILLEIRNEMAASADFDVDLFAEMVRSGHTEVEVKNRKRLIQPRATKSKSSAEPELTKTAGRIAK